MFAAKAAIPDGNTCIKLRDRLGTIFHDSLFEPLLWNGDNLRPHLGASR